MFQPGQAAALPEVIILVVIHARHHPPPPPPPQLHLHPHAATPIALPRSIMFAIIPLPRITPPRRQPPPPQRHDHHFSSSTTKRSSQQLRARTCCCPVRTTTSAANWRRCGQPDPGLQAPDSTPGQGSITERVDKLDQSLESNGAVEPPRNTFRAGLQRQRPGTAATTTTGEVRGGDAATPNGAPASTRLAPSASSDTLILRLRRGHCRRRRGGGRFGMARSTRRPAQPGWTSRTWWT